MCCDAFPLYCSHVILFIIVLVFGLMHGAGAIIIGFGLYIADCLFRYVYVSFNKHPTFVTIKRLPANVIRIEFPKVRIVLTRQCRSQTLLCEWIAW